MLACFSLGQTNVRSDKSRNDVSFDISIRKIKLNDILRYVQFIGVVSSDKPSFRTNNGLLIKPYVQDFSVSIVNFHSLLFVHTLHIAPFAFEYCHPELLLPAKKQEAIEAGVTTTARSLKSQQIPVMADSHGIQITETLWLWLRHGYIISRPNRA